MHVPVPGGHHVGDPDPTRGRNGRRPADHVPMVRPWRSPQGGGVLRLRLSRQRGRRRPQGAVGLPRRRGERPPAPTTQRPSVRFAERFGWTVVGAALAYLFGLLLPRILARPILVFAHRTRRGWSTCGVERAQPMATETLRAPCAWLAF
jgi:hypothetical protein